MISDGLKWRAPKLNEYILAEKKEINEFLANELIGEEFTR